MSVERRHDGRFVVSEQDGRLTTVYVAGPAGRRTAFHRGRVYSEEQPAETGTSRRQTTADGVVQLTSPMPATVRKVFARVGAKVSKGDTLLIVEAMKMELPLRAASDAVVAAVRCREGELVQPDTVLVELR